MGRAVPPDAYWNKFGHPDSYLTRYRRLVATRSRSGGSTRRRQQQVAQATRDSSTKLTVGPTDVHYWEDCAAKAAVARRNPVVSRHAADRVLHTTAPPGDPDIHRDHARRLCHHAFRPGWTRRTANHAYRMATMTEGGAVGGSGPSQRGAPGGSDRGNPPILRIR